jgi:hypothetical protein
VSFIAARSNLSPLATHPPLAAEEEAMLIYQAMASSDDITLVLERQDNAATSDALIIATNRRISSRFGIF